MSVFFENGILAAVPHACKSKQNSLGSAFTATLRLPAYPEHSPMPLTQTNGNITLSPLIQQRDQPLCSASEHQRKNNDAKAKLNCLCYIQQAALHPAGLCFSHTVLCEPRSVESW